MRNDQQSPVSDSITFIFWSDTNQALFEGDLLVLGILFDQLEPGVVRVFNSSPAIRQMALNLGADLY